MSISSRTPEGSPQRCPVCGQVAALEACYPGGDLVCPSCGHLFWLVCERASKMTGAALVQLRLDSSLHDVVAMDSLDVVELVMELEEELRVTIPDDVAQQLHSVRDVVEYLRRRQQQ